MTFDYSKAQATAKRLIKRFGQELTLRVSAGTGDAWNPTIADTDYTIVAAVLKYNNSQIDGTLVLRGDKRLLVSTEGVTVNPTIDHKVVIEGDPHEVVTVMPLSPAGTIVLWEVQVRK